MSSSRFLSEIDDAKEVKALIEKEGRKAVLVSGDIQDPDHCRTSFKKLSTSWAESTSL